MTTFSTLETHRFEINLLLCSTYAVTNEVCVGWKDCDGTCSKEFDSTNIRIRWKEVSVPRYADRPTRRRDPGDGERRVRRLVGAGCLDVPVRSGTVGWSARSAS